MSQTVTQILLPQTPFTVTPPQATGIGSISDNTLYITQVTSEQQFPLGVNLYGGGIPSYAMIIDRGQPTPGALSYLLNVGGLSIPPTQIATVIGPCRAYDVVGVRRTAASYYISNKTLQTVNINVFNFTGTLVIEASLIQEPRDTTIEPGDWFPIYSLTADASAPPGSPELLAANTNTALNLSGNYVWMRARILNFGFGVVNWVKLSY